MKKQERRRLITEAISFAFSNGYVTGFTKRAKGGSLYSGALKHVCLPGLNCYSCPGAVFSCPVGALQAVLGSGVFRVSLYVLGFIGLTGMLFGRLVCGWLCPFGFVQELLYKIPFFRKRKNLPGHNGLLKLKYILLGLLFIVPMLGTVLTGTGFPFFCAWICPSGTLLGGVPQLLINPSMQSAAGLRFAVKLGLLIILLFLSVISYRPFCKYICPLGAIYSLMNPVSLYRYTVDANKCIACRTCRDVCGMDIKVWETPNAPECIRCGRCKAACPQKAIVSSKEAFERRVLIRDTSASHQSSAPAAGKRKRLLIAAACAVAVGLLLFLLIKKPAPEEALAAANETQQTEAVAAGDSVLTVSCLTEDGRPVPGVTIQICSGTLCRMLVSDADGRIEFAGLPGRSYELTPLRAPEGYSFASDAPLPPYTVGERAEIVLISDP